MGNKWKKHKNNNQSSLRLEPRANTLSHIWTVVVSVSVFLGLFVSYYALPPKILVSPTERFESANPLSTLFSVINDGLLPINSVTFNCEIIEISTEYGTVDHNIFSMSYDNRQQMAPGDSALVQCTNQDFGPKIKETEIVLAVSFRPAWWFFQQTKRFAFTGVISSDNKVHWIPKDTE